MIFSAGKPTFQAHQLRGYYKNLILTLWQGAVDQGPVGHGLWDGSVDGKVPGG